MNTRKRLRIQRTSMIYMYWTREVWYVNFSLGASSANLWSACSCKSVMWKVSGLPHWAAWCAICLQLREERPIVPVRDRHASPLPARLAVSRWRHRSLVARSLVSALGWPRVMRRLWRTRLRAPRPDDTRCALHSTYCGVELTSAAELTSALYCLLKRLVWCTVECTVHVCDYEYSNLTRTRTLSLRIRVYVVTLECRALLSLLLHLFTSVPSLSARSLGWTSRWWSQSLGGASQSSVSPRFLVHVHYWALWWGALLCRFTTRAYSAGTTYLILCLSLVRDSAHYFEFSSAAQMTRYLCTLSILTSRSSCQVCYTCILCFSGHTFIDVDNSPLSSCKYCIYGSKLSRAEV